MLTQGQSEPKTRALSEIACENALGATTVGLAQLLLGARSSAGEVQLENRLLEPARRIDATGEDRGAAGGGCREV